MSLLEKFKENITKERRTIVYIHGAGASSVSFNYIKSQLPKHRIIDIDYSTHDGLEFNIQKIKSDIIAQTNKRPFSIISHSLGGVIAANLLLDGLNVEKTVTLSTPFAGSKMLNLASMIYPNTKLFKDAKPSGKYVKRIKNITLPNTLSVISVNGFNPVVGWENNDGVVTVESQKSIKGVEFYEVDLNHNEVLLSTHVCKKIKSFLY